MKNIYGDEIEEKEPMKPWNRAYPAEPGSGPADESCKTCSNRVRKEYNSKVYQKYELMRRYWTHGGASDIKAKSPACRYWKIDE